jgi:3-hydroxymyristoyl/3-hydroxydecanoyl-(acyl carrier protein) dehydratase
MTMRQSIEAARISGPQWNDAGAALFEFRFSAEDPTFVGHFPTQPVLPGVFQLEMARCAAELALNYSLTLREVPKAKFMRPIVPNETVRLELKVSEKDNSIHARAAFSVDGKPAGETLLILWRND